MKVYVQPRPSRNSISILLHSYTAHLELIDEPGGNGQITQISFSPQVRAEINKIRRTRKDALPLGDIFKSAIRSSVPPVIKNLVSRRLLPTSAFSLDLATRLEHYVQALSEHHQAQQRLLQDLEDDDIRVVTSALAAPFKDNLRRSLEQQEVLKSLPADQHAQHLYMAGLVCGSVTYLHQHPALFEIDDYLEETALDCQDALIGADTLRFPDRIIGMDFRSTKNTFDPKEQTHGLHTALVQPWYDDSGQSKGLIVMFDYGDLGTMDILHLQWPDQAMTKVDILAHWLIQAAEQGTPYMIGQQYGLTHPNNKKWTPGFTHLIPPLNHILHALIFYSKDPRAVTPYLKGLS